MSEQVSVLLGDRSYAVHVGSGLMDRAGALLAPFARGAVTIVTDRNVAGLHLDRFAIALRKSGIEPQPIVIDPGENTKSFRGFEQLANALLSANVERDGLIVAFGGGVVGDLAGFAAGVLKRGVAYAQVPTTLLAQVDSSVGGKTAINTPHGKNLVGLFHQPRIVIADTAFLTTLPRREYFAGYSEVVKYGALGDADFFAWLESHVAQLNDREAGTLVHAVAQSCRTKARIVGRDERETGERALLNLGHTFAHALEAATGYSDRLIHGEAVAIGLVLALQLSAHLGFCAPSEAERLERHLRAMSLPVRIAEIPGPRPDADELIAYMAHDKKSRGGRMSFVLVHGIGRAFTTSDVAVDALRALLAA
ncbi:MAG TPA: 3-dehydroquinate synthase [Rhizomicrobium sp.]|jgi:3-dehydroquinate synthase